MAEAKKKAKRRSIINRIGGNGRWPMRTFRWLLFLGSSGFVLGAGLFVVLYATTEIPDPNYDFQTETTHVYFADGKTKIGSFSNQDRESLDYDEIPQVVKDAAIAAEDRTFWDNRGIDLRGIGRALRDNTTTGQIRGGGSTITQQYVKVLYLNQERSYSRKVKEAILSLKIDRQLSKEEILEGYLNTIYFGNGAYGVEVASRTYFNKPAAKLNTRQAAFLATVINNPSAYDPYADNADERILPRYRYVLSGMAATGAITEAEAAELGEKLPKFAKRRIVERFKGPNGHILRAVHLQMQELDFSEEQINGGGFDIVTTFDKDVQDAAIDAVTEVRPDGIPEVNNGLVSVEPGTGAVRAMYGGPDYLKEQRNWAMLGNQPGSTFKIFAVLAGLENGYSLRTQLNGNAPLRIGNDVIENQGDGGARSYGYISLEQATANSVNTAFVDLTDQMDDGPQKILDAARQAGIPKSTLKNIDPVIGVSLGYAPVAPIDMANAYATIASGGERARWFMIEKVSDAEGKEVYQHKVRTRQAIPEDVAADAIAALQTTAQFGTGRNGRTFCPTGGKTGTATAAADGKEWVSSSWFVGITPKLATAVVYNRGENGNEPLDGYLNPFFGGTYPAMTFSRFANAALEGNECGTFPLRANIVAEQGAIVRPPAPAPTRKPEPTKEPEPSKEPEKPKPTKEPEPEPEPTQPTAQPTTPPNPDPEPEPEPEPQPETQPGAGARE